ncbi:multicopper oxidase domain-containing protein [Cryobacterium sp. PH31-AA6]|uniref:multicopper oxidase domain-containing protein n=1 Tax=Cryobacterium sp. PH31-AA6 TaxID=3046205 RepID=UPI0024B9D7D6|nr:multicopper oxidase domain-containing protein [Cryobacterium sp. PH31-AA6]MDJ0322299.1 multicopper oxidase domain-containing protein [Cryobacterium sp. PH31-AA6]
MSRRLWHILTGVLVPAWLFLTLIAVLIHRFLPVAPWLMVHLLFLGAVSSAILIWSQHFADTLLRRQAAGGRTSLGLRLAAHTVGAILVITGIVGGWWPVVLVGGSLVAGNAVAHAAILLAQSKGSLPGRFAPLVRYYIAAGVALALGVTAGVLMARTDVDGEPFERLFIAHIGLNLLGWVGLTVVGTVALLWPTVLHARVQTTRASAPGTLSLFLGGLSLLVVGCLADLRLVTALGVAVYLVGLVLVMIEVVRLGRASPAVTFAGWSLGSALAWFALCVLGFGLLVALAPDWVGAADRLDQLIPVFAVGFAAQILLGALSYLLPVVLGGGPRVAKATARELDRGGLFRVIVVNLGLVVYLLPVTSPVKVTLSLLVVGTLASFLVLMTRAMRVNRRLRADIDPSVPPPPAAPAATPPRRTGAVLAATGVLLLAVTGGVALDPAAAGLAGTAASVPSTGHTTTVDVVMKDTRFTPDSVTVPVGDTLVINLSNEDDMVHNLVLENGVLSGSVVPGASTTVDVGVVGADIAGWCSIAGHKLLGMVFDVVVERTAAGTSSESSDHGGMTEPPGGPSAAEDLDLMKAPPAAFAARDARLEPATAETVHTLTMRVTNTETEVSPGVTQTLWTYNGTAPGPTLHGRVGDVFDITFVNDGTMDHSIDFHAGALAPDKPMRSIGPGESLSYRFTATRSGIWLYHCSTMPMSVHIANGMFGAVIIDPPGLPAVDEEYVLVQSELYLGAQGGEADGDRVVTQNPDLVVFNGYANQYGARPLVARVGERVRIWVLDAGPNVGSSFHVVGGQFDTVFKEGDYSLKDGGSTGTGGSQVLDLAVAQGGFVELSFPEAGHYPFVSHIMSDAEKGARGVVSVLP